MNIKKYFSGLLIVGLLNISSVARAQSLPAPPSPWPGEPDVGAAVSPVRKGDAAPFTGVLLSPKAVATIIAQLDSFDDRVMIEVNRARAEEQAQCTYKVNQVTIQSTADKSILQAKLDYSNKQVSVLEDRLKSVEDSQPNLMLWVGGGFAAGVVTSVATVFLVTKASK